MNGELERNCSPFEFFGLISVAYSHIYVFMRTTVDIPDPVFRRIKATVAVRGETLRSFLLRAAEAELESVNRSPKKRAKLPIVRSKERSYEIDSEHLAAILEEGDRESVARR